MSKFNNILEKAASKLENIISTPAGEYALINGANLASLAISLPLAKRLSPKTFTPGRVAIGVAYIGAVAIFNGYRTIQDCEARANRWKNDCEKAARTEDKLLEQIGKLNSQIFDLEEKLKSVGGTKKTTLFGHKTNQRCNVQ